MVFTGWDYSSGLNALGSGLNAIGLRVDEWKRARQDAEAGELLGQAIDQWDQTSPGLVSALNPPARPLGPLAANPTPDAMAFAPAIRGIESSATDPKAYAALGTIIPSGRYAGDRAYGAYQVMGKNVGPWTKDVLGQEMTPEEFRANPQAQDAVFKAKFGESVAKYGNPQDAASIWFTGRPAAEGANRVDPLGTTGAAYVDAFTRRLGDAPGAQAIEAAAPAGRTEVAQAGPQPLPISPQNRINPQVIKALVANPQTRALGVQLWQQNATGKNFGFQQFGDKVYRVDQRTGQILDTGLSATKPGVHVVGKALVSDTGKTLYEGGDKDAPKTAVVKRPDGTEQTVTWDEKAATWKPIDLPGAAAAQLPPVPEGVDPQTYRKESAKAAIKEQSNVRERAQVYQAAMPLIQRARAAYERLGEMGEIGPARAARPYRWLGSAANTEAENLKRDFDGAVKQLQLTKAHVDLKGGGSVSNFERELEAATLPTLDAPSAAPGLRTLQDFENNLKRAAEHTSKLSAAPAAATSDFGEGATATNPQTGQKIIRRGGQWVPVDGQ